MKNRTYVVLVASDNPASYVIGKGRIYVIQGDITSLDETYKKYIKKHIELSS